MARLINNADQSPFDEWVAGIALNAQADALLRSSESAGHTDVKP